MLSVFVILIVLVVFIIVEGNYQATLDAHVVQRQLPSLLLRLGYDEGEDIEESSAP